MQDDASAFGDLQYVAEGMHDEKNAKKDRQKNASFQNELRNVRIFKFPFEIKRYK